MSALCSEVSSEGQIGGQSIRPELKGWLDGVIIPALVREWLKESNDKGKSLVNLNEDMQDFKSKNGSEVIQ